MAHLDDGSFSTVAEISLDESANNTPPKPTTSPTCNGLPLLFHTFTSSTLISENHITILNDDLSALNNSIESDPEDIWEGLNNKCHRKFGYGSEIKQRPNDEDIKWATNILPIYANWDKLVNFKSLIEIWISKINKYTKKHVVPSSSSSTSISLLPSSTSVPLSFAPLIKGKKVRIEMNEDVKINEDESAKNKNLESEDKGTCFYCFYFL